MTYIVFDTHKQVAEANGRWLYARSQASEYDRKLGTPVNPQITSAWDYGVEMLNGQVACQVPTMWLTDFKNGVGVETELTDEDFPAPVVEEV